MSNIKPRFDIPEPEREDKYHHYVDDDGSLVKVDIKSGEVVSAAPRIEDGMIPGKQFAPNFVKGNSKFWHYNEMYRDLICNMIAQGVTMTEISKKRGFPSSSVIAQWRAKNPDFELAIREARKMQADFYADKIADSLDETREISKDQIPAEKLYYEKLKWLAEKADPEQYGNRTKITGDSDSPLTLIVDTGIRREGPKEVESEIIEGEYSEVTRQGTDG